MKFHWRFRLPYLLALLLSVYADIQAQIYTPLDFAHGQWVCGYDTKGGTFSSYGSYYIREEVKFFCQGDTVIKDTLYNKLFYTGVARYPEWAKRQLSGFFGLIRNDTLQRQVWFGVHLLYDFNLQVGDTLKSLYLEEKPVLSIDSVLYCDTYRRRYNYKSEYYNDAWLIEGIGSVFGLIPRNFATNASWLSCYSETNHLVCDTCKTPTSVNEVVVDNIEIFPNPTNDRIHVTSPVPVSSVEILDMLGRQVYCDFRIDANEIEIPIRERGIFVVRVECQGRVVVRKIVRN